MNENIIISQNAGDLNENKELTLNIQKAMLVALFENKMINQFQYEYAAELLEKNFRHKNFCK